MVVGVTCLMEVTRLSGDGMGEFLIGVGCLGCLSVEELLGCGNAYGGCRCVWFWRWPD